MIHTPYASALVEARALARSNDSHVQFLDGGMGLVGVQLRDARMPEEFRDRIHDFAAKLPKGRWILNGNWDHENWTVACCGARDI